MILAEHASGESARQVPLSGGKSSPTFASTVSHTPVPRPNPSPSAPAAPLTPPGIGLDGQGEDGASGPSALRDVHTQTEFKRSEGTGSSGDPATGDGSVGAGSQDQVPPGEESAVGVRLTPLLDQPVPSVIRQEELQ